MVQCPECGSKRIWKDGIRYIKKAQIQRYLCRSCGHRFSDLKVKVNVIKQSLELSDSVHDLGNLDSVNVRLGKVGFQDSAFPVGKDVRSHGFPIVGKTINKFLPHSREHQVCASEKGAKNLAEKMSRIENQDAGATKPEKAVLKGKTIEHAWWLKKQGYRESTIKMRINYLQILTKRGANLFDPESVKETIANQATWNENTKVTVVSIYDTFLQMLGIKWNPPKYKILEKIPFIPLETELDQLISAANKKLATFLQLLKETAMRAGEAWSLKWIDINSVNNTVRLNTPEKYSNPRLFKVSNKLITMLDQLPNKSEKVFNGRLKSLGVTFMKLRKRLAYKLNNPRLLEITFHTFRHWKATMEYHRTKDILYVKQLLGHKNINNTLRYTQLVSFESDEYHVKVAKTLKEACELGEAGFDYFTTIEDAQIFRKRK